MTSPWKHARSGWYVSVVLPSRRRAQVFLGQVTKSQAHKVAEKIEAMRLSNELAIDHPPEVKRWCEEIKPTLRKRLVELGLIRSVAVRLDWRLGEWWDEYLKNRTDMKPSTVKGYKTARKAAVFGLGDVEIRALTVAQARQFARDMGATYSSEHASKIVERTRQVLQTAVESRILTENPFKDVTLQGRPDDSRQHYIDRATADKVIASAPHVHAAAVIALARYCGLRMPHEVLALRWCDVDFDAGRLHLPGDTKTGRRVLPLFPEALTALRELRAATPIDSEHVLDRARGSAATTWRNWLIDAIRAAGVAQWEKLWINLRGSCRTDLESRFPSHVCDAWLGHSTRVAKDHYLMVTPEDWEKAKSI